MVARARRDRDLRPLGVRGRRPILITVASAFGLAALMIGIWALWHQGMPQFSDVGLL